jgi:hypothetical protein
MATMTIEGRREAQHGAGGQRQHDHHKPDQDRQARAVQQARQHVAPHIVGTEGKLAEPAALPHRRGEEMLAELLDGRVRRDDIGEDGDEDQNAHHADADDGAAILREAAPERAQGAGWRNRRGRGNRRGVDAAHRRIRGFRNP